MIIKTLEIEEKVGDYEAGTWRVNLHKKYDMFVQVDFTFKRHPTKDHKWSSTMILGDFTTIDEVVNAVQSKIKQYSLRGFDKALFTNYISLLF